MREQYKKYDEKLLKNEFISRHCECLPFIGEEYEKSRLLLIGESHYIPQAAIVNVSRADFYDISFADLANGDYKGWINTRSVFEYRVYDKCEFKTFFSNPATEIARAIYGTDELAIEKRIAAMHQYAFMNYFKRPAYDKGKSIKGLTEDDYKYAYEISKYIIEVLEPKLIIFMSKKAYRAYCGSRGYSDIPKNIKCVSHPSCQWWNRRRKDGGCAREDFYKYVESILKKG